MKPIAMRGIEPVTTVFSWHPPHLFSTRSDDFTWRRAFQNFEKASILS
jgi:hypothetical protein